MADFAHEVESAFQKGQLGIQAAGFDNTHTGVAATMAVGAVSFTPSIKRNTNSFTPNGVLLPTVVTTGREYTEVAFDGKATHTDIGALVSEVISDAQIDTVGTITAIANTLGQAAPGTIYTVEAGGLKIPNCIVADWKLSGNRDEVTLSGRMIGDKGTVAAPTAALTPLTQVPMLGAGVVIDIDSSAIEKMFEWSVDVSNMWAEAFFVGSASPQALLQTAIDGKFSVKLENSTDAATLLGYASGTTHAVEITITNGAKVYTISFDIVCTEPGSFSDEEGIYAIEINGTIMHKATKAITITNT